MESSESAPVPNSADVQVHQQEHQLLVDCWLSWVKDLCMGGTNTAKISAMRISVLGYLWFTIPQATFYFVRNIFA